MLPPGSTFGRYTVVRLLGQGGMGTVYLVRHDVLETEFALKVLSADIAGRTGLFVQRFIREAKLSSRIRHPNVVAVHDAGLDEATGLYYLVMDYMPGGTLRDRMLREPKMALCDALRIVRDVAAALAAAAQFGMVHRDIKPENVMFDAQGVAKLADLGIAKSSVKGDSVLTMANAVFGTPAYMSPEQARDSGKVDARADIYSLGIVLYEMLCGLRPYKEGSPIGVIAQVISPTPIPDVREERPDVPESVARLVSDMCDKNVRRRIASASNLCARIAETCGTLPTIVTGMGPVARVRRVRRRGRRQVFASLAAAAVVSITAGVAWWVHYGTTEEPAVKVSLPATVQESVRAAPPVRPAQKVDRVPSDPPVRPAQKVDHVPFTPPSRPAPASEQPAAVPAKPKEAAPPDPPELKPDSVVVLGDGSDASLQVGQSEDKGVPVFALEAENPARIMRQIDDIIAKRPRHVYLRLGDAAQARGISPENFEVSLLAVTDRLREKGVPFTCVTGQDTDGSARYNAAVRDVCTQRSYEYRQTDGK